MPRRAFALLAACLIPLFGQDSKQPPSSSQGQGELKRERQPPKKGEIEAPPEEDESVAPTEYSFNPLQSEKDVRVGNYYLKQRNYRAAVGRYREATRWNERNGEAWLLLGEAAQKSRDLQSAREAYARYLSLAPDAKNAGEVKKKLERLK
jgi:cytochrome c-type biogenesis protein CcmH/NrfG